MSCINHNDSYIFQKLYFDHKFGKIYFSIEQESSFSSKEQVCLKVKVYYNHYTVSIFLCFHLFISIIHNILYKSQLFHKINILMDWMQVLDILNRCSFLLKLKIYQLLLHFLKIISYLYYFYYYSLFIKHKTNTFQHHNRKSLFFIIIKIKDILNYS